MFRHLGCPGGEALGMVLKFGAFLKLDRIFILVFVDMQTASNVLI